MDSSPSCRDSVLYLISEVASIFPVQSDTDPAQNRIVDVICRATEAQVGCILSLSHHQCRSFSANLLWCENMLLPVDLQISVGGTGVLSRVIQRREIQVVDKPSSRDRLFHCLRDLHVKPVVSAIVAPILSGTEVSEAVFVARIGDQEKFGSAQVALLGAFASVISVGLYSTALKRKVMALSDKLSLVDAQLLQSAKLAATGKLAASIAHEINNPLQSVQSCIYLVADGMVAGSPSRQYLDIAREEVDRITKIVQRLADLYRPSQEGQRSTQLNTLLENVLALMSKRFQQSNVKVVARLEPDLPPVTVVADQVKQVFFNLLLNAVEAMPEGGELSVTSQLMEKAQGLYVEILFQDSGVGIAPEAMGRIFDPFYTTKAKGTGLGLSISHDIVERHGGTIRVESRVGNGSMFVVSLPAAEGTRHFVSTLSSRF